MSLIKQAQDALDKSDYKNACKWFNLALEDGESAFALQGLAECSYFLGNKGDAVRYANNALSLDANLPRAYLILAYSYADKSDFSKSLDEIKKALDIEPNMVDALSLMSGLYILQGNTGDALELAHRILRIDNSAWVAHYNLGLLKQMNRQYSEAAKEFLIAYRLKSSLRSLVRLLETYAAQYRVLLFFISSALLFISIRFFQILWGPLLIFTIASFVGLLRFLADHDKRHIVITFLGIIMSLIYFFMFLK